MSYEISGEVEQEFNGNSSTRREIFHVDGYFGIYKYLLCADRSQLDLVLIKRVKKMIYLGEGLGES